MVASVNTVQQVVTVMLKYVPEKDIPALIEELGKIPGNKSFIETIQLMKQTLDKSIP